MIIKLLLLGCLYSMVSCKKVGIEMQPIGSLRIVNAVVGGGTVKLNSNTLDSVSSNNVKVFSLHAGISSVYVYPVSDPAHPYVNEQLQIGDGEMYSLFLGGISSVIDTLLSRDNFPEHLDSVCGVRFVNMYYNSPTLNITLSTSAGMPEFSNVGYKSVTPFKTYPALAKNGSYIFQVRDATTGALLLSYTLVVPRFFNVTLALKGIVGGTSSKGLGVIRVNNY